VTPGVERNLIVGLSPALGGGGGVYILPVKAFFTVDIVDIFFDRVEIQCSK
jgi:hypothetical protein